MNIFTSKFLLNILFCGLILSCPLQGTPFAQFSNNNRNKNRLKAYNSWELFSSKKGGFSVELPEKPEHVEQRITIPKTDLEIDYDTFLSEPSDAAVYVISVWNYPAEIDMSRPEINLQDGFSGMLSALPGSEVLNMNMGQVQGFKALEFLVKNEDIYFQGKLILVHNTLYQVFTVYKGSEKDMSDNYIHFIDSFKLLDTDKRNVHSPRNNNNNRMNF